MKKYLIAVVLFICLGGTVAAQLFGNKGSMLIYDWSLSYTPGTPANFGVACAFGQTPAPGSAPAAAANAGFNTCALNNNFSDPSYAVQTNWLDTTATDTTKIWHCGNVPFTLPSGQPACDFNQSTDPLDSSVTLRARWQTSYSSGTSAEFINTYISNSGYLDFPNFYIEALARIDTTNGSGVSFSESAIWAGGERATNAVNTEMEEDFVELATGAGGIGDAAIHNWVNGGVCGTPCQFLWNTPGGGWSPTAYHKYGWLRTSDGATATYVCAFIDDVFQSCINTQATPAQYTEGAYLIMDNSCNFSSGSCPNMNMYVKYVRVWSCPSWHVNAGTSRDSSHNCNGTTLFNSGGLQYWHN